MWICKVMEARMVMDVICNEVQRLEWRSACERTALHLSTAPLRQEAPQGLFAQLGVLDRVHRRHTNVLRPEYPGTRRVPSGAVPKWGPLSRFRRPDRVVWRRRRRHHRPPPGNAPIRIPTLPYAKTSGTETADLVLAVVGRTSSLSLHYFRLLTKSRP